MPTPGNGSWSAPDDRRSPPRARISGETDFPCIYGERVGLGRSYVRQTSKLDYDDWAKGIREGRNYVSDGKSHLIDFRVNGMEVGSSGSEVQLSAPGAAHPRHSKRRTSL